MNASKTVFWAHFGRDAPETGLSGAPRPRRCAPRLNPSYPLRAPCPPHPPAKPAAFPSVKRPPPPPRTNARMPATAQNSEPAESSPRLSRILSPLVSRRYSNCGYRCLSLIRASAVVNRQLILHASWFRLRFHAAASFLICSMSGILPDNPWSLRGAQTPKTKTPRVLVPLPRPPAEFPLTRQCVLLAVPAYKCGFVRGFLGNPMGTPYPPGQGPRLIRPAPARSTSLRQIK
jgi:hypothetical protein